MRSAGGGCDAMRGWAREPAFQVSTSPLEALHNTRQILAPLKSRWPGDLAKGSGSTSSGIKGSGAPDQCCTYSASWAQ
ncbi:hypothetical protein Y1Q_0021164 [Alligator mississippiensis]|uniref:Uncharacterized protein n=1 Tax=Alligator mississippiensis TaxID=8496 RepID=A0A151N018_ALLMI|nr:hypothetical protein Y1Q_0021164 [Alligator mississippiensis]